MLASGVTEAQAVALLQIAERTCGFQTGEIRLPGRADGLAAAVLRGPFRQPQKVVPADRPRRALRVGALTVLAVLSLLIDLAVLAAGCEGSGAEGTARSITGDGLLGVPSGVEDARSGLQPVLRANAAAYSQ